MPLLIFVSLRRTFNSSLSRSLYSFAMPILYKHVECCIDRTSAWMTIANHPVVASCVRSIAILERPWDPDEEERVALRRFLTKDNDYAFALLGALNFTRKLRAFHWKTKEVFSISYMFWAVLSEKCPFLDSFSAWEVQEDRVGYECSVAKPYRGMQPETGYISYTPYFLMLHGLSHFSYSLAPYCVSFPDHLIEWLLDYHPNLESLRLTARVMSDEKWNSMQIVRKLRLPKLRKLVLDCIDFPSEGKARKGRWDATITFFEFHAGLQEIHLDHETSINWLFTGAAGDNRRARAILPNLSRVTLSPDSLQLLLHPHPQSGQYRRIRSLCVREIYKKEHLDTLKEVLSHLSDLEDLDLHFHHTDVAKIPPILESCVAGRLQVLTIRTVQLTQSFNELLPALSRLSYLRTLGFIFLRYDSNENRSFLAATTRECPGLREVGFSQLGDHLCKKGFLYRRYNNEQGEGSKWHNVLNTGHRLLLSLTSKAICDRLNGSGVLHTTLFDENK